MRMTKPPSRFGLSLLLGIVLACCGSRDSPRQEPVTDLERDVEGVERAAEGAPPNPEIEPPPDPEPLPPELAPFVAPWIGDLDGMVERRVVRVLTVMSPVQYFVDRGRELGATYEAAKAFEAQLNGTFATGHVKVHVLVMPVARDQLFPRLLAGQGDIVAAALTETPQRLQQADFSSPMAANVAEVVVTGPGRAEITELAALSGMDIHVRASSSYAEHLNELNHRLAAEGRPPVRIVPADEALEDGDLLEMTAAGLIPATVVDSFIVDLWRNVFPELRPHPAVPIATGGKIGWAFRKASPKLAEAVNGFIETHKQGSLTGNVLIQRYLKTTRWVKNSRSNEDIARFRSMIDLFRQYSDEFELDWLLMAAQGYQESGLDQSKVSHVGAIGVMQVMPATARDPAIDVPDIDKLENNIHAGIKYDRWIVDNFFDDPAIRPIDRQLLAFASYNAGPSRIAALRREAEAQGLDPNRWFNHVELIAAKRIGRETVQYVANIYKYYLGYQMAIQQDEAHQHAIGADP